MVLNDFAENALSHIEKEKNISTWGKEDLAEISEGKIDIDKLPFPDIYDFRPILEQMSLQIKAIQNKTMKNPLYQKLVKTLDNDRWNTEILKKLLFSLQTIVNLAKKRMEDKEKALQLKNAVYADLTPAADLNNINSDELIKSGLLGVKRAVR